MNSTPSDEKHSKQVVGTSVETAVCQNFIEQVQTISTDAKSPSSSFDQLGKLSNGTKNESTAGTDDSFDFFLPLKVKNYKNGLKKPESTSSKNKLKKKKVTSSSRICPYFSTRRSPTSSKEDRDLKLAIARSLEDVSPSKTSGGVLIDIVNENKPSDTLFDKKPVKQASNFLKNSTSKTKKPSTNTLLFRRTGEERQEIIIKKIGILLVEKENFHDQSLEKLEINLISSSLEEVWDKNCTLWELSKIEVNNLAEFYVSKLEKFIDRSPVASELPITVMSAADSIEFQENYNADIPADVMNIKTEEDSIEAKDNYETKFNEFKKENSSECSSTRDVEFNNCNYSVKDKFLSESLNILSDDLLSLFSSNELSDFNVILKTGESLPCHQFMLQARCPNLLSNVLRSVASNSLDFTQYSAQATRALFKFIYSGKLDFIYDLPSEDKSDLYVLAKKYKLQFLENFLVKSFTADSFHVYSQSTCSPPESPTRGSPDSSLGPKQSIKNKHSGFTSLAQESFEKDKEKFSTQREHQVLSFANLAETINNFASTSGLNSSKKTCPTIAEDSLYDIFKDEIKSPCNSSLLSQSFQSKRKLDYTDVLKETKKICPENVPIKQENSPEIVTLDSDSNEECLIISKSISQNTPNAPTSFLEADNNINFMGEDLFKSSSSNNSSDFNINDYFHRSEEVSSEANEISPLKTAFNIPSTPLKSPPRLIIASPPNKERSIDKYFEASFPEVNENLEAIEKFSQQIALTTPPVNKNLSKKVLTPLQEIIIGEATPKPDYNSMVSPELKAELKKYGIKPDLDPRKARSLLQYIYEQIHPVKAELPKRTREPLPSTSKARSPSPVITIDDDSSQSDSSDRR